MAKTRIRKIKSKNLLSNHGQPGSNPNAAKSSLRDKWDKMLKYEYGQFFQKLTKRSQSSLYVEIVIKKGQNRNQPIWLSKIASSGHTGYRRRRRRDNKL